MRAGKNYTLEVKGCDLKYRFVCEREKKTDSNKILENLTIG